MSARNNLKDYTEEEISRVQIQIDIDDLLSDYRHEYRSRLSQLFSINRELVGVVSHYAVMNSTSHDNLKLCRWCGWDRMTKNFMRGFLLKLNGVYLWECLFFDERDPKWSDKWVSEMFKDEKQPSAATQGEKEAK